ncbi:MAG: hypothetical protein A3I10_04180 [Deltaproteobacteria bacterium RIFCSPLOWO2_02_FULL_57_26]|nr:MAG: hypothetical protein A3I10_04180 [Deltaproteobacteria bacterium RIFCSPLOWO2_02_FULL_57_26]
MFCFYGSELRLVLDRAVVMRLASRRRGQVCSWLNLAKKTSIQKSGWGEPIRAMVWDRRCDLPAGRQAGSGDAAEVGFVKIRQKFKIGERREQKGKSWIVVRARANRRKMTLRNLYRRGGS